MQKKSTTLIQEKEKVYTSTVPKKNRQFKMDDDTYGKLTAIAERFGMKRAAVLRLIIHEKLAVYRYHGMIGNEK